MAHTDDQDAIDRIAAYMTAVDASPDHDGEIIAGAPTHDAPYLSGSDLRAALTELKQQRDRADKTLAIIARVTTRMNEYGRHGSRMVNVRQVLNLLSPMWPDGNYSSEQPEGDSRG